MAKAKAKVLTRLRIDEVSSVDRGAGDGVKIMLMKLDEPYWKREFSQKERDEAADSGAAMSDGSYPIKNKSDLHNAMQAIGRAKNPGKTKAHIRARARALGLTDELTEAFKMSTVGKFFTDLFKKSDAPVKDRLRKATNALAESVASITQSEAEDRGALLAKTFAQFQDHIDSLSVEKTGRTNEGDDNMLAILRKSLGLKDDASEDEIVKAIEASNRALGDARAAVEKAKADLDDDEEKEDADEKDDEKKKAFRAMSHAQRKEYMRKKHLTDVHPEIQKILKQAAEDRIRVEKLENERELSDIRKVCTDIGMAPTEAETIQKAYKGDKEAVDKLIAHVKAANLQAKAAGVWKELGSTGGDRIGSTAMDQLNAKAAEYRKAHPDLSEQQAFSKVYQDPANAKLVQQERAENRPAA